MTGNLSRLVTDLERIVADRVSGVSESSVEDILHRIRSALRLEVAGKPLLQDIADYSRLAALLDLAGRPAEAGDLLDTLYHAFQGHGREQAMLLNQRGMLAALHGDHTDAATHFEEALFTPGVNNLNLLCLLQTNLASAALRGGDLVKAEAWALRVRSAEPAGRSAALDVTLAQILFQVARHRADQRAMAAAADNLAEATSRRIGELGQHETQCLVLIGNLASAQLAVARSQRSYERAETVANVLSITALRLSAAIGSSDPRALEARAAAAIAQFDLARDDGSLQRIEQATRSLETTHDQAAAVLDRRDPRLLTLSLNVAIAHAELARSLSSPTHLASAINRLRHAAAAAEAALGAHAVQTLEAQANLAIAELDAARASRRTSLVEAAIAAIEEVSPRVETGLGRSHPLSLMLNASLRLGNSLLRPADDQAGRPGPSSNSAVVTRAAAGQWGMDREYLSLERAVSALTMLHAEHGVTDKPTLQREARAQRLGALLVRAQVGDRDCLREIVTEATSLLWNVVRAQGLAGADAEDVVQAVWLSLVSRLTKIETPDALVGWLVTAAKREAWRVREARRRTPTVDTEQLPDTVDTGEPVEERILAEERRQMVRDALGKLDPRCAELLRVLSFSDQSNYATVARTLRMPQGSIGPSRRRCLNKLHTALTDDPRRSWLRSIEDAPWSDGQYSAFDAVDDVSALESLLLDLVQDLYAASDPVPLDLLNRVDFAMDLLWPDNDNEVALLQTDLIEAVGVHGGKPGVHSAEHSRTITFDSESMTIVVQASPSGETVRVDGWLAPPGVHRVLLRTGDRELNTESDELGGFVLTQVPHGVAQVIVETSDTDAAQYRTVITTAVLL